MKHVYIILSQTGTFFSKAIQMYTKDPYNHASLAFESDVAEMYSFGRRRRYNLLNCGFVRENFQRGIYPCFPLARCCILEIPVTDEEYAAMIDRVKTFIEHDRDYGYNLLGVLVNAFGRGVARKNRYFCSQFVSDVLNITSFWSVRPECTKPMDFCAIPHKQVLFEGDIVDFYRTFLPSRAAV